MVVISLETNYNKKLQCDTFCHISRSPSPGTSVNLGKSEYTVTVKDNPDLKVTAILMDTVHCKLVDIRSYFTQLSHNMSREFFQQWWLEKYPGKEDITIYFYKRIN